MELEQPVKPKVEKNMVENEKPDRYAAVMKRDWDERAREDAKWYINTLRRQQSEEEFDRTGQVEIDRLVMADLSLLTRGRDAHALRLLEIGCGAGRMTRHFADIFGEVIGVDVSGEMIRQASERMAQRPNVKLFETNGVDFTIFPDQYFDLIFSAYVYQHVPSAEVIASNLGDAWRVLAPGGVFKFQTSGVTAADFQQLEKNTWSGAPFPEERVRQFARERSAQMVGIFGAGTQYCWTILRKREDSTPVRQSPRIEFYGRTVDAGNRQIPTGGDEASLTVILSGLDEEWADCNSVRVEIREQPIWARYVGSVGRNFEVVLRQRFGDSLRGLMQVEIGIPAGISAGPARVRLLLEDGQASDGVTVEFIESSDFEPRIGSVMNVHDDSLELDARGPRSRLRILVEGLDETASIQNVVVWIGDARIVPLHVGYLPGNAVHEVVAQLPGDTQPGELSAYIQFGRRQSPPLRLEIR